MKTSKQKNCCQGCKKGKPGTNKACQRKLLQANIEDQINHLKSKHNEI